MSRAHATGFRVLRGPLAVALGLVASGLFAEDAAKAKSPPPPPSAPPAPSAQSDQHQAAFDALDGVIARFEALLARDNEAKHKAATAAVLEDFKQRRAALRGNFDQSRYDELRVDLNLEYQRLASWTAPPGTPPRKR